MLFPLRKIALLSILTLSAALAAAQVTTQSPYSRYGIGDLNSNSISQNFPMAGLGIGTAEKSMLNLQNPAATSYLLKPVFDVGVRYSAQTLQTTALTEKSGTTFVNHFSYAFPFKSSYTLTASLIPLSRVGYHFNDEMALNDSSSVFLDYRGSGGLTKAILGNAFQVIKRDSISLAVGLNINYIFGTLYKERRAFYPAGQNYFNLQEIGATTLRDFSFDLGALFSFYPTASRTAKLTFGATYSLSTKLRADQETVAESFVFRSGIQSFIDTVDYINDTDGSVKLPAAFGFGTSLTLKERLIIGIDYHMQQWSAFEQTVENKVIKDNLRNSSRLVIGMQYTPKTQMVYNSSIFNFCTYRIGFRSENTYLQLRDTPIDGSAFSTGISIPLRRSNSGSKLTLGYEYSSRGTTGNNLIKERYSGFMIGVSLSPNNNDRWFFKRKYD